MIVNTNMGSINAQRNLTNSTSAMQKSLEKLSSGYRINRAADDAAGLAISEKMRSQISGLNQAKRNSQDGISLLQIAEGALSETHSILQRMRQLTVQGANDTLADADRTAITTELDQLTQEIDRIAVSTTFNGANLLDNTFQNKVLQVGAYQSNAALAVPDQTLNISINGMDTATLGVDLGNVAITDNTTAQQSTANIDTAIATVSDMRSKIGAWQNRLGNTINNLTTASENVTSAESRIRDVDMAQEMSQFVKSQVLNQAGVAMLAQANQTPQAVLKLLG